VIFQVGPWQNYTDVVRIAKGSVESTPGTKSYYGSLR